MGVWGADCMPKPIVWDEVGYEGDVKMEWGLRTGAEEVSFFWWGLSLGCAGVTHGETMLDHSMPDDDRQVLWWGKGGKLRGVSAERLVHLARWLEKSDHPLQAFSPWPLPEVRDWPLEDWSQATHDADTMDKTSLPYKELQCYALRYMDLWASYCGAHADAMDCQYRELFHHWQHAGQSGGRRFGCDHLSPLEGAFGIPGHYALLYVRDDTVFGYKVQTLNGIRLPGLRDGERFCVSTLDPATGDTQVVHPSVVGALTIKLQRVSEGNSLPLIELNAGECPGASAPIMNGLLATPRAGVVGVWVTHSTSEEGGLLSWVFEGVGLGLCLALVCIAIRTLMDVATSKALPERIAGKLLPKKPKMPTISKHTYEVVTAEQEDASA